MTPRVSLIVEMGTRRITGTRSVVEMLRRIRRAVRPLPMNSYEIILVGDHVDSARRGTRRLRWITESGGYFGSKNTGAEQARGEILVFWDSDCTAAPDYLAVALAALDGDASVSGLTGKTSYEGSTLLARLNTALSFGYLHAAEAGDPVVPAMAHNLVIRKACFEARPFGLHSARTGGDLWLTHAAVGAGRPVRFDPRLRIYHEDPSFKPLGLFERHLREHFQGLYRARVVTWGLALAVSLRSVLRSVRVRRILLGRYGRFLGMTRSDEWLAAPLLVVYGLADAIVVGTVAALPPLLDRWLSFQFGMTRATWTGPPPGVETS